MFGASRGPTGHGCHQFRALVYGADCQKVKAQMQVDTWEAVLVGVLVLVLLMWFGPGVKRAVKDAPKGSSEDWKGALIPLAMVLLFVFLLIAMVRR
jgi:hypothetical protein